MKKYISLIAVFLTVGIAGCKKDYLSLENNPNQPSITTPDLALPAAQVALASIVQTGYPIYGIWGGYWTTSGNYVPNQPDNQYQLTTGSNTGVWDQLYLNLSNLNTLETLAAQKPATANYQAIAMILKAYDYEQLVDNFNNVPYSQAFDPKNITPAYDNGIDIYHDLGKQLDAAIALINKNNDVADGGTLAGDASIAIGPTTSDVMFGGQGGTLGMASWKKFANTLKLRLAIRVSNKFSGDPLIAGLASTGAEGYLDGSTDAQATQSGAQATVNPGYTGSNSGSGTSQQNPFYNTYGLDVTGNPTFGNVYYRANTYAIDFYKNTNDPRIAAFYAPNSKGAYQGNVFGDTQTTLQNPFTSPIGPGLLIAPTQNAIIFSGAESLFLQAEALLNGWNISGDANTPTTAQAAYQDAITASFVSLGLTATQATTYYSQPLANVSYTSSGNKQTAILTQKWAALNGLFNLEAYNEYRRTGVPNLPSSIDPAAISTTLPTRILYPTSELSTNAANLGKQGTISPFTSKIFWAK